MTPPAFATPVLLAALLSMPLGFLWFGPLFGKQWMHLTGVRPSTKKGPGAMPFVVSFLMSMMIATTLAILLRSLRIQDMASAMILGVLVWAAFDFLPSLTHALFEKRPMQLVLINSGYELLNTVVAILLLSVWA